MVFVTVLEAGRPRSGCRCGWVLLRAFHVLADGLPSAGTGPSPAPVGAPAAPGQGPATGLTLPYLPRQTPSANTVTFGGAGS